MQETLPPLHFRPILKEKPWGGRNMAHYLGKALPGVDRFGESWEIAHCGADSSVVSGGCLDGVTLPTLLQTHRDEIFGDHDPGGDEFPLLVKYLDANEWLSVQVHPDDAHSPTGVGKTEAWVVLRASPESSILAGLKRGVGRAELESAIASGTVLECLNSVPVSAGDCISIPAGTVHAIGPGVVIAEIQQQSDCTYRFSDWGRGRELHIDQAMDCMDFDRGPVFPVHPLFKTTSEGVQEQLVSNEYFRLDRTTHAASFQLEASDAFSILMVVHGRGRMFQSDGIRELRVGSTVLVPAHVEPALCVPDKELTTLLIRPPVPMAKSATLHRRVSRPQVVGTGRSG
ncbi:MAG: type I phosphomannose isomerase catalytic subunit [Planctomycetaceae bacterium]